jgi:hypothetical protein
MSSLTQFANNIDASWKILTAIATCIGVSILAIILIVISVQDATQEIHHYNVCWRDIIERPFYVPDDGKCQQNEQFLLDVCFKPCEENSKQIWEIFCIQSCDKEKYPISDQMLCCADEMECEQARNLVRKQYPHDVEKYITDSIDEWWNWCRSMRDWAQIRKDMREFPQTCSQKEVNKMLRNGMEMVVVQ